MTNETFNPQMKEGWKKALAEEFSAEYMKELKKKVGGRNEVWCRCLSASQADFSGF